jgi:hypothetical protein
MTQRQLQPADVRADWFRRGFTDNGKGEITNAASLANQCRAIAGYAPMERGEDVRAQFRLESAIAPG